MNFQTDDRQSNIQKRLRGVQCIMPENYPDVRRNVSLMPPLMQKQSAVNQIDRNRAVSEVSNFKPRMRSSTSTTEAEMPLQDNMGVIPRSTASSVAGSVVEFNDGSRHNAVPRQNPENASSSNFNFKIFGSTESEKMFIFTGTVERVIKWNKIFRNHFCYYEVIASVISIQEGSVNTQKIMLLRDRKGPILQVVYYSTTHIDIQDFHVEQVLRCVGRMSAPNILNAVSIRSAEPEEVETLQRHCLACDQAISHFLSV
ncbi:uncharacterized protein LOC108903413 [Anoplophora glabripennis]|uniref:uncharacterized protein LOC108903413 n=1 Tax=Anoplophora glabripennis TaxID=217634 RepID=UPI0008750EAB|nr:uncharacterized protein LOC108903413 [Anoplophora glabripennis]